MGTVVLGTFSCNNYMRLGKFFPKIGKLLTLAFKDKKVTHSNIIFTYAMNTEKIYHWTNISKKLPEKVCISCGKDTKRYHKSFHKTCKAVFTMVYPI